ncbi:hypothetical protein JD844_000786 [Phrynosoma platyrhinos]|uniref:Uncharacterized protein n=1 Tax=Phrynosoma platyrhinos TaxID=52577 RepID=A0ABQ7T8L0_PHRPL|nr:hypothetical protein JD844_000786 [Phrynosoma platyrhinos]
MTKDYQDVTSVETEDEGDLPVRTGRKIDADLSEMQESLKSINRTVFLELAALKEKEANEGKVFTKMNAMAKNLTEEVKEAKTHFEDHISKLQTAFLKLNCELEDTKHNRSGQELEGISLCRNREERVDQSLPLALFLFSMALGPQEQSPWMPSNHLPKILHRGQF